MPLVQEDNLPSRCPKALPGKGNRKEKIFKGKDGVERGGNRWLRAEEGDEAERSVKVKRGRANAADRSRVKGVGPGP